jgi:hypothetical protein
MVWVRGDIGCRLLENTRGVEGARTTGRSTPCGVSVWGKANGYASDTIGVAMPKPPNKSIAVPRGLRDELMMEKIHLAMERKNPNMTVADLLEEMLVVWRKQREETKTS